MAGAIAVRSITAAIIQAVKTLAPGISGQVITAEIIMAALIGADVTMATIILETITQAAENAEEQTMDL